MFVSTVGIVLLANGRTVMKANDIPSDVQTELEALATIGLAAERLLHDLGNCLNRMLMQAALLRAQVPPGHQADIGVIVEEGRAAAQLLQPLRRQRQEEAQIPVDLASAVRDALADVPEAQISLALSAAQPRSMPGRLRLFLRLLRHASAAEGHGPATRYLVVSETIPRPAPYAVDGRARARRRRRSGDGPADTGRKLPGPIRSRAAACLSGARPGP